MEWFGHVQTRRIVLDEKLSLAIMLREAKDRRISFGEYCLQEQARQMEIDEDIIYERMANIINVMRESVEFGLSGIKSVGGLVGGAAKFLNDFEANNNKIFIGDTIYCAVKYAIAVAEANAAMGRVVAAPTAGSSGVVPAVLFSLEKSMAFSNEVLIRGLVTAGTIGMVIASRASLSGAAGGCQAECGSAAAMAAGAAVDMLGGSTLQIGHAVAIALKNMLGLVCDPVAGLVEVPCVKRNAGAAGQALIAAQLALAGVESFIPVDEVIDAMQSVGVSMHCSLKETAQGGLAVTPTALEWAKKLFG